MKLLIRLVILSLSAWAAVLAQTANGVGKGEEPPTLYEMTAHSELVVAVKILSGQVKLARVEVEEVFRGSVEPGSELQIAFRDFNLDLGKADRILFVDAEPAILFLIPEVNWEGTRKGPDRFTLYRGRFGKFDLPREGADVYREAVRVFAGLADEKDHRRLFQRLRSLLGDPNPVLAQAGLREVLRLDLMEVSLLPSVLPYLRDLAPARRIGALRLLGKLFANLKSDERTADIRDQALAPVQGVARNDPDESVRIAAVEALGSWGGSDVRATLDAIAELDEAQGVRYKAKVILLKEGKLEQAPGTKRPGSGQN